jgi:2,3-bisphosphoglycerate-independent phosphoglycerate mutase
MPEPWPHVCLVIMDGWGIASRGPGNAIALADTPVFDRLWSDSPHSALEASGGEVGLPPGQMGNSCVTRSATPRGSICSA